MKTLFLSAVMRGLALLLAASVAHAQDRVPFHQQELDQMLAPIALYPDALLSQVLMASTYPLEVAQAARWSKSRPGLKGQDAVNAIENLDWDPSVKSLTAFPQILSMMDEKPEWTERLGEAFLAQQADVMSTVQGLRRRAEAAGNLRSSEQMRVARQGEAIVIEPPAPGIVYVPYYSPIVVYGPWWWPAYPPVYWAPPPAYYVFPAHRPAFVWGSGIVISAGFFFAHFDWPHRHVNVVHVRHHHPDVRPAIVHTAWRHDPARRRGVPFRRAEARLPETRITQSDRNIQPGRSAPQVNDRRWERRGEPRSQTQSTETQRAVIAPVVRSDPRSPAMARAMRAESQQAPEGRRNAEARANGQPARATPQQHHVRERAPAPRTAASVPNHAPRMDSNRQGSDSGVRARGNPGRQRPGDSDNNRKP